MDTVHKREFVPHRRSVMPAGSRSLLCALAFGVSGGSQFAHGVALARGPDIASQTPAGLRQEMCPLPGTPGTDPCTALQTRDCGLGLPTDFCMPRIVQVSPAGIGFEALECGCFPEGPDCGPIVITPDLQVISCPGICVPPDVPGPCLIFADDGTGPVSTGLPSAPAATFPPGVLLTCDCPAEEPCPLPQSPAVDPCASLQMQDCVPGLPTDLCLPRIAQVAFDDSGFEALQCACFPESDECGPIIISPDSLTVSCPGNCVPPDAPGPCIIFADYGGGPVSTGMQSALMSMFPPGVPLTCDCPAEEPCPLPSPPDDQQCAALQMRDCLDGLPNEVCLPQVAQVALSGSGFEAQVCDCFPESPDCGPIIISPDGQTVFCPGNCVPPDVPGPCIIFADYGAGPASTGMQSAPVGMFPPGVPLTCDCPSEEPCPLPPAPDDWQCAALQMRDCLNGHPMEWCLPRIVQVGMFEPAFEALECDCFSEDTDCGPIIITPDGQQVTCPGICVPPDVPGPCLIFADFGAGPVSTGLQTAPLGMFPPGVPLNCDCEVPLPAPQPAPPPFDRRMNRILAWDPSLGARAFADPVAYRVELKQITLGSCDVTGGFCREGKKSCSISAAPCTLDSDCPLFPVESCNVSADCNTCSANGGPCINPPIDCTGGTCAPNGETCVNDAPDVGGTSVGTVWWVGKECPTGSGQHLLVSEPFRLESTTWPTPTLAGDCEIAPQAIYGIRAYNVTAGSLSGELPVETTLFAPLSQSYWADAVGPLQKFCAGDIHGTPCTGDGDCTPPDTCDLAWTLPDGAVNFDDVQACLWAWTTPAGKTIPPKEWMDLHGNACNLPSSQNYDPPNNIINASDVQGMVFGFAGRPYTYYDPADCPATTHCGGVITGTPCTSDLQCTSPDTCEVVCCSP